MLVPLLWTGVRQRPPATSARSTRTDEAVREIASTRLRRQTGQPSSRPARTPRHAAACARSLLAAPPPLAATPQLAHAPPLPEPTSREPTSGSGITRRCAPRSNLQRLCNVSVTSLGLLQQQSVPSEISGRKHNSFGVGSANPSKHAPLKKKTESTTLKPGAGALREGDNQVTKGVVRTPPGRANNLAAQLSTSRTPVKSRRGRRSLSSSGRSPPAAWPNAASTPAKQAGWSECQRFPPNSP